MIETTTVPGAKAQQGVRSVEIGMTLLQALAARARSPLSLSDIATATGLAPAKAHRYLVSLIRAGMVEQDQAAGRYRLGGAALNIGLAALSALDVMRLAGEALTALRDAIDETVLLAVWGNKGPVVVRWEEASRPLTTNVRAGSVMPLLNSSTGRVFAAFLPASATQAMIADETTAAPQLAEGYMSVLEETRARGMGRVDGDLLPGVAALSAPVFDHQGDIVAVMSALGAQGQFNADWDGDVAKALRAATAALSRRLGFSRTPASEA
ncbi:MAG: IclR family transcriptional regulator [Alphaproteobacteria bacterium]|nr:IclR family transcriptional regulator [Alphaproteobacteria bacterium]